MVYAEDFAEIYDGFYSRHKDIGAEVELTRALITSRHPHAASLLDVGCGTGEHLRHLRSRFDVAGVDASPAMVRIARRKLPGVTVHQADMRTFRAGRTFDAICSIYSCVGYLEDQAALTAALANMVAHLNRGGVLVIEPWIFAEDWNGGELACKTMELDNGRVVTRMGQWRTEGAHSVIDMHYLVGGDNQVRHFIDDQRLVLLSRAEYRSAFEAAGLRAELITPGFMGRGVFVAVRP